MCIHSTIEQVYLRVVNRLNTIGGERGGKRRGVSGKFTASSKGYVRGESKPHINIGMF
jgi:hypothetical protein